MNDIPKNYSNQLELNIKCGMEGGNICIDGIAVLHCMLCDENLCKSCSDRIHSRMTKRRHELVPLTKMIQARCYIHPSTNAHYVCKKPSCEGMNKPICTMCREHEAHKFHEYEMLEYEHDRIIKNITIFKREIETKQATCEKNLEDYDKCIATYSSDDEFMKNEREKIDKFYSDARALALQTFDDFANDRVRSLKLSKNQYIDQKLNLDDISSQLRNIEDLKKIEVIQNEDKVKNLGKQVGKEINEPSGLVPSKYCYMSYPIAESMNFRVDIPRTVIAKSVQLKADEKFTAVYWSSRTSYSEDFTGTLFTLRDTLPGADERDSELRKFKGSRPVYWLKNPPNVNTIDSALYNYISVVCATYDESSFKKMMKVKLEEKWWSRIIVVVDQNVWNNKNLLNDLRNAAGYDKRVEFMKYDKQNFIDTLTSSN